MPMRVRMLLTVALASALGVPGVAQTTEKRIQCWTDKNGQRMCGDRVPPEYAGQKRQVFEDGRVVDTIRAAKTPEEIAEEQRQKEQAEKARKQAEYDRALLETYRSAKDIEAMRDERVAMIELRLRAAEKNAADTDKSLESLRARAEARAKEGKPVDEKLAKQIREFERAQKHNEKALARYRKERDEVAHRFNGDLARYRELRGIPAPPPGQTPAAPANPAPTPAAAPASAPAPKGG
jgi:hypothetical protein